MRFPPTTQEILNLDGVHRRVDHFRYELCNRDLFPIGELHPSGVQSPTIQNDSTNRTTRRLTGLRLTPSEAADVNVIADRLRVYLRLQNGEEFRLGTFLWADASRPERSWGREQQPDLVDFNYILDQQSTQAFGWGAGATIYLIMLFLFFRAGFELDDLGAPIGDEATRGLSDPLSWNPGTTWHQMLTDLGNVVGFAPPWFDRNGKAHLDQLPDPAVTEPSIPPYDVGTRVIADSVLYSDNLLDSPNDFAVTDSGTSNLLVGRFQLPPSAPHSFANRGFRIGKTESAQGITSQGAADNAAAQLARKSDALEFLTFSSTADPRHETHDVLEAFGERWLETSWSLELRSGGPMQHTMKRTFYDVI